MKGGLNEKPTTPRPPAPKNYIPEPECSNCGKKIDLDEPPYYMVFSERKIEYFCNGHCCQEWTKPKCETCLYFFIRQGFELDDIKFGDCRRHAPSLSTNQFFPLVGHNFWCGDNKPRKNVSDPIIRRNAENEPETNPK